MAEVTVSQEVLEKLKAETRQFKKGRRFLTGMLTLMSLGIFALVIDSVFTKTCPAANSAMSAVTTVMLFGILCTHMMVLELKRTIVQLFQNK